MIYDAVFCVGPQHLGISVKAIRSVALLAQPRKIFVITGRANFDYFQQHLRGNRNIELVDEGKLVPGVDLDLLKTYFSEKNLPTGRAGWYLQQFLKMGLCQLDEVSDHYLIWDSDTVMLKPIDFFDEKGRVLINPTKRYIKSYFDLTNSLLDFDKCVDFSFVSEHLMVNKRYMQELIQLIAELGKGDPWPLVIMNNVNDEHLPKAGFSEFETYGTFVHMNYPDSYVSRPLRSLRSGVKLAGLDPKPRDFYTMARKYSYVSFEVWTKPARHRHHGWKWEAIIIYGIGLMMGLFSRKIREKTRFVNSLCENPLP